MKLKGLVWFFAIALIIVSLWELSYTWAVRSFESKQHLAAEKYVKKVASALKGEEKDAAIEKRKLQLLDSLRDKEAYPIVGTSYQDCKKNELNLGLDLQGGINVTMDVSLEGLIKSLSINPADPQLLAALKAATAQKVNSDAGFVTLFTNAYKVQNPNANLAGLFAGAGKEIKTTDSDSKVIAWIQKNAEEAIGLTYTTLQKRIDKFGVSQPTINLDKAKGIINVELAGVKDPQRVRDYLTSSANLQFWEMYTLDAADKDDKEGRNAAFVESLKKADENLYKSLYGDSAKIDSTKLNPFFRIMNPMQPYQDKKTKEYFYPAEIGRVALSDTGKFFEYTNSEAFKRGLLPTARLLLGKEEKEKAAKGGGEIRFFNVYAIKTIAGSDKATMEGDAIESARDDFSQDGKPIVTMRMTASGTRNWARMTTKNTGLPVAITLDDVVYSAPNVNGPIEGGNTEISGKFTVEQTQDLSQILKSGKLSAPAKIVAETEVGPTLGAEAVRGGKMAFIISFAIIFILMLVYFNTAGWVANIALILNLLFTVGVLATFGFTLTAAGIAGLVLTIGMAVDTNVIIFERIKEELTKGKSYEQAVNDGYKRSLAPVIDAHVTTLLTAIILAYFGLGPVLGFATTQIIGILLSLFCGILVSRLITDFWTNKKRHFNYFTGISKRVFKHAAFKFIEYRKVAYGISVVVLIAGIGAYFNGFNKGVEFEGGRSFTVAFDRPVKNSDVQDDLKAVFGDFPVIKTIGDSKHLNITTSYLKGVEGADSTVKAKLYQGLKKVLGTTTYEQFAKTNIQGSAKVEPSISDDLKKGAIKATVFAILIIFVYIFIRFRDWRYSLGTIVALLHDVLVTLAVFSFLKNIVPFSLEIDQHFIAAVLTVIGFSMNDTVIVFDRVREYSRDMKGADKGTIINKAINDTLSRTIMTSLTVFLTILILFIFGGEVTRGFAFAMLIGVVTGTYSSIFVAAPILVDFAKDKPLGEADLLGGNDTKTVVKK
jgi:SecD/SecF fusion protein